MSAKRSWVVTASGDRSIDDLEKRLTDAGFTVDQVLGEIGCITGTATDAVAERLRTLPGVADVSPETKIDIGPPDAPITW